MRLQLAVTPPGVVGDHLHIQGIVLRGKGTEAVPLFFKFGFGRKGDGLRVRDQSGNVGASGGGWHFRRNTRYSSGCWGPQRGGCGLGGGNWAGSGAVVT